MANLYTELRNKQQKEFNAFPILFAFNQKQFNEGMAQLGLSPDDTDKLYSIGQGYIRKTDSPAFNEMMVRHDSEMSAAINDAVTGDQFIFDMFNYELANHEYFYTGKTDDAIAALGLTYDEIAADERLLNGLKKAIAYQRENDN